MENYTISRSSANELNLLVKKGIDSTLWLICNFEPRKEVHTSYDGKSISIMLDMYIFSIDVGLCEKINKACNWNQTKQRELKYTLRDIGRRRSVLSHNQSQENGNEEDREWYDNWMKRVIGKSYPNTESEWREIYNDLKKEERKLIQRLEELVCEISRMGSKEKEGMISEWKACIEIWYRSESGRKAIIGQWKRLYIAKNPGRKVSNSFLTMNNDIKNQLFEKEERIEEVLKEAAQMNAVDKERLLSMREAKKEDIKKELEKKHCKKNGKLKEENMYAEWYISRIQDIIGSFCKGIIPSEVASLLPQDLVQYICMEKDLVFKNFKTEI